MLSLLPFNPWYILPMFFIGAAIVTSFLYSIHVKKMGRYGGPYTGIMLLIFVLELLLASSSVGIIGAYLNDPFWMWLGLTLAAVLSLLLVLAYFNFY